MTIKLPSEMWGPRRAMRDPAEILSDAASAFSELSGLQAQDFISDKEVKLFFKHYSSIYYSLAAMSRRYGLTQVDRDAAYRLLFPLRAKLEKRIIAGLRNTSQPLGSTLKKACKSFFGKSTKQGVSVRFPLSTCEPTKTCGARCYAHDGRDRDYQRLFRGALNGYIAEEYEKNPSSRQQILSLLSREIDDAIASSRREAREAQSHGFDRSPRIRFSHVGEMSATPEFTNDLAREIKSRAPDISLIVYTRHPGANLLSAEYLIINFTLDGKDDKRKVFAPSNARLVNSSWDGKLSDYAEINFLEHHVEKISQLSGEGTVCPVTLNHVETPTCDSARCEKCFVPVEISARGKMRNKIMLTPSHE